MCTFILFSRGTKMMNSFIHKHGKKHLRPDSACSVFSRSSIQPSEFMILIMSFIFLFKKTTKNNNKRPTTAGKGKAELFPACSWKRSLMVIQMEGYFVVFSPDYFSSFSSQQCRTHHLAMKSSLYCVLSFRLCRQQPIEVDCLCKVTGCSSIK